MNIGKYEYSKTTIALSGSLLIAGAVYGIATKKPILTILLVAMVGSAMGLGLGMILYPPKRIAE